MKLNLDLTYLLDDNITDYSVVPYGLRLLIKSLGIDIETIPEDPRTVEFYSATGWVDWNFDVSDSKFEMNVSYDEY